MNTSAPPSIAAPACGSCRVADWLLRLVVAGILVQTLFFKFTGAPESLYLFTKVGMEPWGRWGSGVAELIAAILILWPGRTVWGALLAIAVMSGALFFHLTKLGIDVQGDHGELFALALIVFVGSIVLVAKHSRELPFFSRRPA
jgi:putative oxidoreductase